MAIDPHPISQHQAPANECPVCHGMPESQPGATCLLCRNTGRVDPMERSDLHQIPPPECPTCQSSPALYSAVHGKPCPECGSKGPVYTDPPSAQYRDLRTWCLCYHHPQAQNGAIPNCPLCQGKGVIFRETMALIHGYLVRHLDEALAPPQEAITQPVGMPLERALARYPKGIVNDSPPDHRIYVEPNPAHEGRWDVWLQDKRRPVGSTGRIAICIRCKPVDVTHYLAHIAIRTTIDLQGWRPRPF